MINNIIGELKKELMCLTDDEKIKYLNLINEELKRKLINLSISDKIEEGCEVSFVYVTNKVFDRNATEFLSTTEIEGFDNNKILQQYISVCTRTAN